MNINLFLLIFLIIVGLIMSTNDSYNNRRNYIIISIIVLILVAALRDPATTSYNFGVDTLNYEHYFESFIDMSWSECWAMMYMRYFGGGGDYDMGFILLCKFIGFFTHSFFIYSIIADLLFFVPLGIILYRYTDSMWQLVFAFVFYVIMIQDLLLAGARQIFAIGFDMMALLAMINRKQWLSIVLLIVGVTIHFSSFLFLVPLLMIRYNVSPRVLKLTHTVCFLLFPIVFIFPNQVIAFLGETSGLEKYTQYGTGAIQGGATTFIILIEGLSLFIMYAIKQSDLRDYPTIRIFYVMMPLLTLLAPLIRSNGAMIRISIYYHMYLALLVPYAIDCLFSDEDRGTVYVVAIAALSLLSLRGGDAMYYFFWQHPTLYG